MSLAARAAGDFDPRQCACNIDDAVAQKDLSIFHREPIVFGVIASALPALGVSQTWLHEDDGEDEQIFTSC